MFKTSVAYIFLLIMPATTVAQEMRPIVEARELLAKRDREGATQRLLAAIAIEKSHESKAKLMHELKQANNIFFTDLGQRTYELAESIRYSGQQGFLKKYEEADKAEFGNESILVGLILSEIGLKECKSAAERVNKLKLSNPYKNDLKHLEYRVSLCAKTKEEVSLPPVAAGQDKNLNLFRESMLSQKAADEKRVAAAVRYAKEAQKIDADYPQSYYWAWLAVKDQADAGAEAAEKYVSLCKDLLPATRRKYYLEPELCVGVEAVEEYLKKQGAP